MQKTKAIIDKISKVLGYKITKLNDYPSKAVDIRRIQENYNSLSKVKLHFGCGPRVLKGWINIDLFYEPYDKYLKFYTDKHYPINIRGTVSDFYAINFLESGIPLPDNSVDIIFHEDFFEHLTQKEQVIFLAETWRVLKKNAVHRINTPNLTSSMRDNSDFTKGKYGVYVAEWENWHHLSIMSPETLEQLSKMIGYSNIIFNSKDSSIIADELPLEYRPDENDRHAADSNVFADLIK